jgi:hypothetical protein
MAAHVARTGKEDVNIPKVLMYRLTLLLHILDIFVSNFHWEIGFAKSQFIIELTYLMGRCNVSS